MTVAKGGLKEIDPKETEAWAAIQSMLSRLSADYIKFILGDPGVGAAYEALHTLHVLLVVQRSWEKVSKRFGVKDGPGCLLALADTLCGDVGPSKVNPRLRAPLKAALLDFFLRIVGDDPVVRNSGTGADVLAAIKPGPFQSTSALFLGAYLTKLLRHEELGLSKLARQRLQKFSESKANQVIDSFQNEFTGHAWRDIKQVGFSHLFRVMRGEPEWLSKQLRKNIRDESHALNAA